VIGLRVPILHLVAGIAVRGESLELSRSKSLVAGVAFDGRVRADQWKAILVLLDCR
jgi:hypothetical protein